MSCPFLQFVISSPPIGIVCPHLSFLVRGTQLKFLFQDVNLVESDIDQKETSDEVENKVAEDDLKKDKTLDVNVEANETAFSDENFVDDLPEPEVDGIKFSQENFEGGEVLKEIEAQASQLESKTADTIVAGDEDELTSGVSDDQDESTVVNNYDGNNDSAYETNEMNSRDGSNSRLQSANTNEEDVDYETGENYNLTLKNEAETETERELLNIRAENSEILRLEHELENPPTPDDDADIVIADSAGNPLETGVGTADDDAKDEVL